MKWETPNTNSEITAIHAALLPTEADGVILYFGDWASNGNIGVQNITHGRLYHLSDDSVETIAEGLSPDTDAFCAGQSFLADGRLLVAGGTLGWAEAHDGIHKPHYDGERACWIYMPRANKWVRIKDLNFQPEEDSKGGGRWYPTLITLANGQVFTVGGHPTVDDLYSVEGQFRHNNNTPERYSPGSDKWHLMFDDFTAPPGFSTDGYPRFHLMPNGLLFSDTAGRDQYRHEVTNEWVGTSFFKRFFDPYAGEWVGPDIGGLNVLPEFYDRGSAASSVLLPLLLRPAHTGGYQNNPRILATNSGTNKAYFIDTNANNPEWKETVARNGNAADKNRANGCATLLPTGQVLVTGGWPGNSKANDISKAVTRPELYTPGINWDEGDYSNTNQEKWETIDLPAPNRRGYHSTALLMPDGRVWHGGSTTKAEPQNREIDIFEPDYFDVAGRPVISSCPANIGYNMNFRVDTPQARTIARVALIRCGSITHGFNTDQRYVAARFTLKDNNTLGVSSPSNGSYAPPGYYMLWLIDKDERVCQRAAFIRISKQKIFVTADISTYSIHEVEALGSPAIFSTALYIVADGFLPSEITTITHKLLFLDNEAVPGVSISLGSPMYEGGADHQDIAQRIVYPVDVRFDSAAAFDEIPASLDSYSMNLYVQMDSFINFITLNLSKNPNPRMSNGDPPWLSVDLRVFKTNPGNSFTAGVEHPTAEEGAAGATSYIQNVLDEYNNTIVGSHPFDSLPTHLQSNKLELGINDKDGIPTYNYAIARVRFRAPEDVKALDVRVFFRMWTTGWTSLEFNTQKSYRRSGNGGNAVPLLGLEGGEVNNFPCFAQPRKADMEDQEDTYNRKTLEGVGSQEVHAYFGCWLDINQDKSLFPLKPIGNGPYQDADNPQTIQQLMRGLHQCLLAEIHYTLDPIPSGSTPGSSDNLAQRNILFDNSDNPGSFAAHLVHHTFELKPSPYSFEQTLFAATARLHPDELVIEWGNLPKDSLVTLYMPQVNTDEIVRADSVRQSPNNLQVVGPGTLRCKVTEIGFMPIPGPMENTIAGLLSVQLPPGVPYGAEYKITLRQVSGRKLKVLGTTEFRIKVDKAEVLLPSFEHNLAILKHIALAVPNNNRWQPIFERYLAELGDRVRAVGGDPDKIPPSPFGRKPPKTDDPQPKEPNEEIKKFTGKVTRILYGCFGDFEGFEVKDCNEHKKFMSQDCGVEKVALAACKSCVKISVIYNNQTGRIKRLNLIC